MKKTITFLVFSILFIEAFAQTRPPYVPTNGLVAWYPFDGNAGDSSGHGNNGTVSGATTTSDRNNNANRAYSFNGTTNYIYVAPITALSTNISKGISLSFWANAATSNTGEMIDLRSNDNSSLEATVYQTRFNVGNSNMPNQSQSFSITTNPIAINQWMHFVIVQDSARSKTTIYKNGMIDTSLTKLLPGILSPKINMGSRFDFYNVRSSFWNGKLDDIGIWSRELTQQEITNLFNSCNDTISVQPTDQSGTKGTNKTFTITHSGTNVSYQWQSNPIGCGWQNLSNINQYTGTSTNSFMVSGINVSNHLQLFRVVSSSSGCKDTSNIVRLNVTNIAYDSLRLIRLQNDSMRLTNDSINYLSAISFLKTDTTNKGILIRQLQTNLANKHDTVYIASSITGDTLKISIHTGISLTSPTINSLKVYPNPASTILHVDLGKPGYFTAKISALTGQSIITPTSGTIDISSLANGIYILTIYDSNGKLLSTNKISIVK